MRAPDPDLPADAIGLDRREFLRLSTAVAAAGALASAGCQVPQETTVPYHDMPEDLVDGLGPARFFRTVLDGTPVQVKTREGRPILVTPAANAVAGRGLSVRHHASLMDLYDPDRARTPLSVRRGDGAIVATSWAAVGADVVNRLKSGAKAVLLTSPISSPAVRTAIEALRVRTGLRHVEWSPLASTALVDATARAFGPGVSARPRLDKADLIVGLGAEFLDRPENGFEPEFAMRRSPDGVNGIDMNRFVQFESRLTLTGANADKRIRVRDSQLAHVGAALAHELIVGRKLGPLAGNASVASTLNGHGIDGNPALAGVEPSMLRSAANELASAMGRAVVVADGSASGSTSGLAIEASALLLNVTLGAIDAGLLELTDHVAATPAEAPAMASLLSEMQAGAIDLLLVAGVNVVYDAPASFKVGDALARVSYIVSMNDRVDETSRYADVLAPLSHPFECWSDVRLPGRMFAVQQPVVQPLFDTRGLLDVLVDWCAALGDEPARAAVIAATSQPVPAAATGQRQGSTSLAWHYLRAQWASRLSLEPRTRAFEEAWNEVLRSGMWEAPRSAAVTRAFDAQVVTVLADMPAPLATIELQLYPHNALHDGRAGNNGWLHELPDPVTRLTWGGAVSIAPRRFDEMQLAAGDFVEIESGHGTIIAPAYRHAGMHHDQIALPLGLGRTACGAIGDGIGVNAFPLRILANDRLISSALPVTIRKISGRERLADAQGSDVIDRARRPLVPAALLSAYEEDRKAGTEQIEGGPSAWPEHEYAKARWAMAIDLSKCTGCAKCVIGCQAENNIPIVGRQGILDGRPMSWLRIDRYYDAPRKDGGWDADVWDGPLEVVEDPQTLFEPMLCQHCENAPCETVCPFSATMHSEDGLNQQIYNRCVGTRYCGNNCPFKVRRFNYFELSKKQDSAFFRWLVPRIAANADLNTREPMQLKNNPEVTVRSRGVMEKCSFCVQRIRAARATATREGRSKDHFDDGAVVPACMEACSTGAISFGDRNAPGSKVAELSAHPRAMKLLESVGVKPSVSYLTKVRNDRA